MKYEEIELIKQSAKSTVHLVREKNSGQIFIRKVLKGQHPVYTILQEHSHPFLPAVHEVVVTDDVTTVVEEYIEGEPSGNGELSETQFLSLVRELCSVLEFLHGQGIIHRDIKPSNIIMAKDGHIRLIDFDAARQPKDDLEQDTMLLGTRGYAPPEQYGFSQTDERADIYSLGVTLTKLGGKTAEKAHYKRVIRKCMDVNPTKRYQSVRQVRRAFFSTAISFQGKILPHGKSVLCAVMAFCIILLVWSQAPNLYGQHGDEPPVATEVPTVEPPAATEVPTAEPSAATEAPTAEPPAATEVPTAEPPVETKAPLAVPPAPANPHWDGNTGIAVWGNVPESIYAGEWHYHWKLYRKAENAASGTDEDILVMQGSMRGNNLNDENFNDPMSNWFKGNGFYYFTVCAKGDGIRYGDSPYATSDLFEYTGESAPELPLPTDLAWALRDINWQQTFYATWGNFDEYEDSDYFSVTVYDKDGKLVTRTRTTKEYIMSHYDVHGIPIRAQYLTGENNSYRFVLQVISARPNEYRSTSIPDPIPEEYYSPWISPNTSQASNPYGQQGDEPPVETKAPLAVLPVPANPHWDGDTGVAVWGNVPESIYEGNLHYYWNLYRKAEDTASGTAEDALVMRGTMSGNKITEENFDYSMSNWFKGNGVYYFTVCAKGDGIRYSDSPYVTSDLFEYTGEYAPELPLPTELAWATRESNGQRNFYATWGNLDEYEDSDSFSVTVYDKDNNYVIRNIWTKETIMSRDIHGISIRSQFLTGGNNSYRFVVQAISSRPNEYRSTSMPNPIPEEYYSPWISPDGSQAPNPYGQNGDEPPVETGAPLAVLPAPANPHWDGDTGVAVWGNVPESIYEGNLHYYWNLYRKAEDTASGTAEDELVMRGSMSGNGITQENFYYSMSNRFKGNGVYYFTVCAKGDGIRYSDSPYVTSDLFEYTGEYAPELPLPTELAWVLRESNGQRTFYATWGNLDEYEDSDSFSVTVYDKDGKYVAKNIWTKETIMSRDVHGISIRAQYLTNENNSYRFVVQAISSRPNEYRSTSMPNPIPEEYYSPWISPDSSR